MVKFSGERSSLEPTQIAFRNSSGQVNFGCGEGKAVSVSWSAPAGADQINASAAWTNTDNVKSQYQHVDYSGTTATAAGSISGRDRDWLGNCPGGHGELVIQGTYRILQPTSGKPFESLQSGTASVAKPFIVPLPVEQDLHLSAIEATVIPDGGSPIVLNAAPIPASGSSDTIKKQNGKVELAVSGREATITLGK